MTRDIDSIYSRDTYIYCIYTVYIVAAATSSRFCTTLIYITAAAAVVASRNNKI